jgi:hypothetical protein
MLLSFLQRRKDLCGSGAGAIVPSGAGQRHDRGDLSHRGVGMIDGAGPEGCERRKQGGGFSLGSVGSRGRRRGAGRRFRLGSDQDRSSLLRRASKSDFGTVTLYRSASILRLIVRADEQEAAERRL